MWRKWNLKGINQFLECLEAAVRNSRSARRCSSVSSCVFLLLLSSQARLCSGDSGFAHMRKHNVAGEFPTSSGARLRQLVERIVVVRSRKLLVKDCVSRSPIKRLDDVVCVLQRRGVC